MHIRYDMINIPRPTWGAVRKYCLGGIYSMNDYESKKVLSLLKTSQGQIKGIIKMIEDDRYCVDISKQILSVQGQLKKANLRIIDQHIKTCVKKAFTENQGDEKVDEIIEIINKYAK